MRLDEMLMIRRAKVGDAHDIAKIVVDSWKTVYKGIVNDNYLDSLNYEEEAKEREQSLRDQDKSEIYTYVYLNDSRDKILGFIVVGPPRDRQVDCDMEIYAIYVDPQHKNNGIGTKLIHFTKKEIIKDGYKSVILWCLKDNFQSRKFYEKMGGKIIREKDLILGNQTLKEVGFLYYVADIPVIETERILMRKFKETDMENMFEYASDKIVTKYLNWNTYKDKKDATEYISSIIRRYNNFEMAPWAIEYKEDRKMIGSIDIRYDRSNFASEIGYVLNRNYWNKGIMTEALKEIIDFGFKNLNVNRIEMLHDVRNEASGKVMLKNGFKYEGMLRNKRFEKGEFVDLKYYSILREEYMC